LYETLEWLHERIKAGGLYLEVFIDNWLGDDLLIETVVKELYALDPKLIDDKWIKTIASLIPEKPNSDLRYFTHQLFNFAKKWNINLRKKIFYKISNKMQPDREWNEYSLFFTPKDYIDDLDEYLSGTQASVKWLLSCLKSPSLESKHSYDELVNKYLNKLHALPYSDELIKERLLVEKERFEELASWQIESNKEREEQFKQQKRKYDSIIKRLNSESEISWIDITTNLGENALISNKKLPFWESIGTRGNCKIIEHWTKIPIQDRILIADSAIDHLNNLADPEKDDQFKHNIHYKRITDVDRDAFSFLYNHAPEKLGKILQTIMRWFPILKETFDLYWVINDGVPEKKQIIKDKLIKKNPSLTFDIVYRNDSNLLDILWNSNWSVICFEKLNSNDIDKWEYTKILELLVKNKADELETFLADKLKLFLKDERRYSNVIFIALIEAAVKTGSADLINLLIDNIEKFNLETINLPNILEKIKPEIVAFEKMEVFSNSLIKMDKYGGIQKTREFIDFVSETKNESSAITLKKLFKKVNDYSNFNLINALQKAINVNIKEYDVEEISGMIKPAPEKFYKGEDDFNKTLIKLFTKAEREVNIDPVESIAWLGNVFEGIRNHFIPDEFLKNMGAAKRIKFFLKKEYSGGLPRTIGHFMAFAKDIRDVEFHPDESGAISSAQALLFLELGKAIIRAHAELLNGSNTMESLNYELFEINKESKRIWEQNQKKLSIIEEVDKTQIDGNKFYVWIKKSSIKLNPITFKELKFPEAVLIVEIGKAFINFEHKNLYQF